MSPGTDTCEYGALVNEAVRIAKDNSGLDAKLDKNQGENNAGKFLGIDDDGFVVPTKIPESGGIEITGALSDMTAFVQAVEE